jgi:predicted nucleic acid-binding protein
MPEAVYREINRGGATGLHNGITSLQQEWIEVLSLRNPPPPALTSRIDEGEAAVIALALEQNVCEVLIDDRLARRAALDNGLKVGGTIAVLLRAKNEGLLSEIKDHLETMRSKGIYLSQTLVQFALKEADEDR